MDKKVQYTFEDWKQGRQIFSEHSPHSMETFEMGLGTTTLKDFNLNVRNTLDWLYHEEKILPKEELLKIQSAISEAINSTITNLKENVLPNVVNNYCEKTKNWVPLLESRIRDLNQELSSLDSSLTYDMATGNFYSSKHNHLEGPAYVKYKTTGDLTGITYHLFKTHSVNWKNYQKLFNNCYDPKIKAALLDAELKICNRKLLTKEILVEKYFDLRRSGLSLTKSMDKLSLWLRTNYDVDESEATNITGISLTYDALKKSWTREKKRIGGKSKCKKNFK